MWAGQNSQGISQGDPLAISCRLGSGAVGFSGMGSGGVGYGGVVCGGVGSARVLYGRVLCGGVWC